ncbi:MAG: isochorismatase [Nitrospirota bacterium]
MPRKEMPVPPHYDPKKVGSIWKVPYQELADRGERWAGDQGIVPASDDRFKLCLIAVDVQNSFCIPGFELFVGGRSGLGAVDDNRRLCEFIYRNLDVVTQICPTMDTHQAMQIFHAFYLVNDKGEHPAPFTIVSEEDVLKGVWKFNGRLASSLGITEDYGKEHLLHYARRLKESGKYDLTVWPYHAMLGGIGHALVSAVDEAIFFHCIARHSRPDFHVKGDIPFTEHYSVLGPEVLDGPYGEPMAEKSDKFLRKLFEFDAVVIAGQAKSHCVAWTIEDLLRDILSQDRRLSEKVYLLEDCASAVVVPGVIDYTDQAETAFRRFADAGMHVVRSTVPIDRWPGIKR